MDDTRLNKLEVKIDEIKEDLSTINTHLAVYNEQLKIHIKGTQDNSKAIKHIEAEIEPIKDHVKIINMVFKAALWISGITLTILEIKKLING